MALYDESFYTNIYHDLPKEYAKTIQNNITLLQSSSDFLDTTGNILSFGSIFTGPLGKASAFITNRLFDDLDKIGEQKLNDKIIVIARNEESAKLINTLYETKHGLTPHIIMLSELVKRQQDEITELSQKYDSQSIKTIYNNIISNQPYDLKLDDINDNINKLNNYIKSSNHNKDYYNTFNFLSHLGTATNCNELSDIANVALSSMVIYDSVNLLSSGLSLVEMINPLTSILCVGMGLFNMFKKKKSNNAIHMQLLIKQLDMIKQQLVDIRLEIKEQFSNVFRFLDNITEKLHTQQMILLNTYYKIEQIEKSILNINIVCEYYGKHNLLQDFYRTIYKITQGNSEYFENLGHSSFNDIFLDIFYWIENHSFDCGVNGYIYSSANIISNLNTNIANRIGYLASLLNFSDAQHMLNHTIFNTSINALEILIHKALSYYGKLPLSYNINSIINKANLTLQFIEYSRQPHVLNYAIQNYNNYVDQLQLSLSNWVDINTQKYNINILNTIDEIISATPITTTHVQAVSDSSFLKYLPINLQSINGSFSYIYKICDLAKKLKIGDYDFKFSLSWTDSDGGIGWKTSVTINIYINFILNGTSYCVYTEQWYINALIKSSCRKLYNPQDILYNWHHCYQSQRWTLQDYTKSNTYFENIIKQACLDKVNSIKSEITTHTQLNTLCDKIQDWYIIILKLFELNNTKLDGLNSGIWTKTRILQLLNHENTDGHTILTFCNFCKTKALNTQPIYNESIIYQKIKADIDKLNELSNVIIKYQEEYKYIQDANSLVKKEYDIILENEKILVKQQVKDEIKNINTIGMQIGRSLTINTIIKKLEQTNKSEELEIIKENFKEELECDKVSFDDDNSHLMTIFNSSFCNGSSMALLEISLELRDYTHTITYIQMMGQQILSHILINQTKSIGDTITNFMKVINESIINNDDYLII